MKKFQSGSLIVLILAGVAVLVTVWEFLLEDTVRDALGISEKEEDWGTKAEYIITGVVAAALALVVPVVLLHRISGKKIGKRGRGAFFGKSLIGALGTVFAVLGVSGLLVFSHFNKSIKLDPNTLCPVAGPVSMTAILIDQTDSFSAIQREDIRKQLREIKATVPRFGAIKAYAVGENIEALAKPIITVCNPGNRDEIDKWTESRRRAQRQWDVEFDLRLENEFEKLLTSKSARNSPIIESVQSISVDAFGGRQMDQVYKKLVIVSDLLQHSENLSLYKDVPTFNNFRKSPAYEHIRSDLRGVDIEIIYLRRTNTEKIQRINHLNFWKGFFEGQGARLLKGHLVPG